MDEQSGLFDWKQLRLWRFSYIANVLSPIVLVVYALTTVSEIYRYNSLAYTQYQTNLIGLFSQEPIYILDVVSQVARVLLQGAVYYLVLKGIALGLTMIVETDINYRDKEIEEGEE